MMFTKHDPQGYKNLLEGIRMKTLTYGEKTLLSEFYLEKGHTLPRHSHPQEQIGYLISGKLIFTFGDQIVEAGPGDSWCVPGGLEHSAEIIEDSLAVEVFSPVREDYLP